MERKKIIFGIIVFLTSAFAASWSVFFLQSPKLAIAAYVVCLGLIILAVQPFAGLVNYLILIYLRPQEFIDAFRGMPIMLIVGGATLALTVLHYALIRRSPLKMPQDYLMVWLYGAIVASHLANAWIGGAIGSADEFLSRMVVYLLVAALVVNFQRLRFTMYLLLVLTLYHAIQGIIQYHTGIGIGGQTMVAGRIQGIGIFADPNYLAMTLLIMLPLTYLKFVTGKTLLPRVVALVCMAVLIYALFLTNSRGGFISFGVLIMLMFSRRFGYKTGLVVGALFFTAIFAVGPERMREFDTREESAEGRVEAWAEGLRMLETHPLFGVGAWNFTTYHYREAHNSFVNCASELGLFGLMPWILLFVTSLKQMRFIGRARDPSIHSTIGLYSEAISYAIIAFMVSAFFISVTFHHLLYIIIGLASATTSMFISTTGERYELFGRRYMAEGVAAMVVGLLFLKVYLLFYW